MPALWSRSEPDGAWTRTALRAGPLDAAEPGGATVVAVGSGPRARWVLVAPPLSGLRVNGVPLLTGVRLLRDRDALAGAGPGRSTVWFTDEQPAVVEPLPADASAVICVRCRQPLDASSPAVRCPGCGAWHHQRPDLPCWRHAPRCALCPQSTAADAPWAWTPEHLR